jgi:hypothetical protein
MFEPLRYACPDDEAWQRIEKRNANLQGSLCRNVTPRDLCD